MEQVAPLVDIREADADVTTCRHCGLVARVGDDFCCYGCEIAAQIVAEAGEDHAGTRNALGFSLLLTMTVMMFALFLYAEDIYGATAELGWLRSFYRGASAVLAAPVMVLCGVPLARRGWSTLRSGRPSMSALIVLGAFAAYGLSILAMIRGAHAVYFDTAAGALVLGTLGRYLEATARTKAAGLVGQRFEHLGDYAVAGRGNVAAARLEAGMRIRVPPEVVVPVDLRLESDSVEVDVGVLTGESAPKLHARGAIVPSGSVPIDGPLTGVALADARHSTLEQLTVIAKRLRERPSALLELSDRFARVLTPLVAGLACVTLVYWTWHTGIDTGVGHALAVVLVACPCTYAVAAPLTYWLAIRRALREHVLVRGADVLEQLAEVHTVAFDKTGTLTEADLSVTCSFASDDSAPLVAALEAESRHPRGRALVGWAGDVVPVVLSSRRFVTGVGVEGVDEAGRKVQIHGTDDGATVLVRDGDTLARFTFEESIRSEAAEAIAHLQALGLNVVMLTGDAEPRAAAVAERLGLRYRAALTSQEKADATRGYAMVGDGINDAAAIAGSAVGIAMPSGTDLSKNLAGVTLRSPDLRLVASTIALAREATNRARRLLLGATIYNTVFIALAVTGMLRPVWAGLSMLVSSLLTVVAATRTEFES